MSKGVPFFSTNQLKQASKKGVGLGLLDFGKQIYDKGADVVGAGLDYIDKEQIKNSKQALKNPIIKALGIDKQIIEDNKRRENEIKKRQLEDKQRNKDVKQIELENKGLLTPVSAKSRILNNLAKEETKTVKKIDTNIKKQGNTALTQYQKQLEDYGYSPEEITQYINDAKKQVDVVTAQTVSNEAQKSKQGLAELVRGNLDDVNKLKLQRNFNDLTSLQDKKNRTLENISLTALETGTRSVLQPLTNLGGEISSLGAGAVDLITGNKFKLGEKVGNQQKGWNQIYDKMLGKEEDLGTATQSFIGNSLPYALIPETKMARGISAQVAKQLRPGKLRNIVQAGLKEGLQDTPLSLIQTSGDLTGAVQRGEMTTQQALSQAPSAIGMNAIGDFAGGGLMRLTGNIAPKIPQVLNETPLIDNLQRANKLKEVTAQRQAIQAERLARDTDMEAVQNALEQMEQRLPSTANQKLDTQVKKLENKRINEFNKIVGKTEDKVYKDTLKARAKELKGDINNPINENQLSNTYKEIFGLENEQAKASAVISDRILNTYAQRKGITLEQAYKELSFKKSKFKELQKGVKFQGGEDVLDNLNPTNTKFQDNPDIRFQSGDSGKKIKRPDLAEITGDKSIKQIYDNTGSNYNAKYEVIEAPDIHASITKDFVNNPNYEFTNTRDRAGNKALKIQVDNMSEDINPALLSSSHNIQEGAPIIGKGNNSVLSGNGRTAAIQRAYAKGKAEHYKQFLIKNAKELGLDPEQIAKMKQPILARRVLDDDVNIQDFIEKANTTGVAQRTPSEQAFADTSVLDEADPTSKKFIENLSDSEKTALLDAKGKLNQYGEQRLANAKLAKAFGETKAGKRLVEKLANSGDDGIKKIGKALSENSGDFLTLGKEIKDGKVDKNYDIRKDFLQAIEEFSDYKAIKADERPALDEFIGQGDVFTGGSKSDKWSGTFVEPFFRELAKDTRSTTALSKSIKEYFQLVKESKNQLDFLGQTKQPHTLLNEAFETENFKPLKDTDFIKKEVKPEPKPELATKTESEVKISQKEPKEPKEPKIKKIAQKEIKPSKPNFTARGALETTPQGKKIIHALTNPDVSTPLHELAHVYEEVLTFSEKDTILKWAGSDKWDINTSEKFAEGFEKYLADGKAPTVELKEVFEKFKNWLLDIYKGFKGSKIDHELTPEMRKIYDSMIGTERKLQSKADNLIEKGTPNTVGETKSNKLFKTIENNPLISDELKAVIKEKANTNYEVRNTKDLFDRATDRVNNEDLNELSNEIRRKSRAKSAWTDEEVATGYELARKFEAEGKLEEAMEIEEALAKKATEGGQMIQAYAKYGKTTPEGAIREANKVLENAMPKEKIKQLKQATDKIIKDFSESNKKAIEEILSFCPPKELL